MTVAHYVQEWLPLSAGFVHALVRTSRHRAVVLVRDPLVNRDAFPHRPVVRVGRSRAAVAATITGARAGVVHAHFGYAVHDVAGVARRLRRPLVLSLHGHDATARDAAFYAGIRPDAVVVPSAFLADRARELGFEDVHAIPAGVDTTFFTPVPLPDAPPRVAFVGRLVEKKGVDVLLDAWPRVRAAVPGAELHVLGEGPLEHLLAGDVVHHRPDAGRRHHQVRDLLRDATVVCQPSRTGADGDAESLLLVNLEAQATGRPVVTTRHGGIPEFVDDGRSALLVPEGDSASLADALVAALRDPAALPHGPEVARRFDLRACTARVDDLYDSLR